MFISCGEKAHILLQGRRLLFKDWYATLPTDLNLKLNFSTEMSNLKSNIKNKTKNKIIHNLHINSLFPDEKKKITFYCNTIYVTYVMLIKISSSFLCYSLTP
jgi:hypothetical protein